jgi:hypothetical protein
MRVYTPLTDFIWIPNRGIARGADRNRMRARAHHRPDLAYGTSKGQSGPPSLVRTSREAAGAYRTMRVMALVKATRDSRAGIVPSTELLDRHPPGWPEVPEQHERSREKAAGWSVAPKPPRHSRRAVTIYDAGAPVRSTGWQRE